MTAKNIYDMEEHVSSDADEFLKGVKMTMPDGVYPS